MGKHTKDQSRRAAAEAAAISSPSSTPAYPPPAAAFADNEAGGSIRKPGIKQARRCQDLAFLSIISLLAFGFIVDTSFGFNRGDPHRLVFGLDYKGNVCGDRRAKPNLKDFKVRYWMNPNQLYWSGVYPDRYKLSTARSICLRNCPTTVSAGNGNASSQLSWVCDYPEGTYSGLSMRDWEQRNYDYFDLLTPDQIASSRNLTGPCYPVLFESVNLYWNCQPSPAPENNLLQLWNSMNGVQIQSGSILPQVVHDTLSTPSAIFYRYMADLGRAWPVLFVCGGLLPMLLCMLWLIAIRYYVGVVTWLTFVLLNVFMILLTLYFYFKAGWLGNDAISAVIGTSGSDDLSVSFTELEHLKALAIIMTLFVFLTVVMTFVLLKRVTEALSITKVTVQAIGAVPSLVVYPAIPFIAFGFFFIYWLSALLYLFSAGKIRQNNCTYNSCASYDLYSQTVTQSGCCGYTLHSTHNIVWAILYHLFVLFWAISFIAGCSVTTISGAIASYYWARGETAMWNGGDGMDWKGMGWFPVVSSAKLVLSYSLGSISLGSSIVPLVETFRVVLSAVQKRLKKAQRTPGGVAATVLNSGTQGCSGCIEWTLKFINRNAYVVIAISGKNFFRAAGRATVLIANNSMRVGNVNNMGRLFLSVAKLCVSLACAVFAFLMLDSHSFKTGHYRVSSPLFPVLFCLGLGYMAATLFFAVVGTGTDTILIAYCMDSEEHNGTPIFAPALLAETLTLHAERQDAVDADRHIQNVQRDDEDLYS
ncbi:unnamed protein product [Sphagnum jensenii]|uniref:Choline transporter-like protein n=1 Tax=Sphagnum jensenii TaxID=128206 RepID=A0ABP1AT00_9BRYO